MKKIITRQYSEIRPDGTHITKNETIEEEYNNGLADIAIAFIVFFGLFLGSCYFFKLIFVPSPQNPNTYIGERI
ncbi:hypothetical protein NIES4101_74160 [Calothrix sp. NIES-4101]|nr:hypothetical protein NIES4101_74160 [Calothrix sp. NIES-4101]